MTDTSKISAHSREEAKDERPTDAQDHAVTREEKLDEGLLDSMDASDPPATTKPGDHGEPVASSDLPDDE